MRLNELSADIQALFPIGCNLTLDINAINDGLLSICDENLSPLIYAITTKNKTLVDALLKNGADPNLRDEDGRVPMTHALPLGDINVAIVRLLVQRADLSLVASTNREDPLYNVRLISLLTDSILLPDELTKENKDKPIHRIAEFFPLIGIDHLDKIPEDFKFLRSYNPDDSYGINDPNSPLSVLTAAIYEQLLKRQKTDIKNASTQVNAPLLDDLITLCMEYVMPYSAGKDTYLGATYSEATWNWLMTLGRIHYLANQHRASIASSSIVPSNSSRPQIGGTSDDSKDDKEDAEIRHMKSAGPDENNIPTASSSSSSVTSSSSSSSSSASASKENSGIRPPIAPVRMQLMNDDISQADILASIGAMFGDHQESGQSATVSPVEPRPHIDMGSPAASAAPVLPSGGINGEQVRAQRLRILEPLARGKGSQVSSSK